jgi:hypothetical protein
MRVAARSTAPSETGGTGFSIALDGLALFMIVMLRAKKNHVNYYIVMMQ